MYLNGLCGLSRYGFFQLSKLSISLKLRKVPERALKLFFFFQLIKRVTYFHVNFAHFSPRTLKRIKNLGKKNVLTGFALIFHETVLVYKVQTNALQQNS